MRDGRVAGRFFLEEIEKPRLPEATEATTRSDLREADHLMPARIITQPWWETVLELFANHLKTVDGQIVVVATLVLLLCLVARMAFALADAVVVRLEATRRPSGAQRARLENAARLPETWRRP